MEKAKAMSVIFDVSRSHGKDGRRNIDCLKKALIEFVQKNLTNGLDSFHLYNPSFCESSNLKGKQISLIGNYETDGLIFNLTNAFRQSLDVLLKEEDSEKFIILITDRLKEKESILKVLRLNKKKSIDLNFVFVGLGENYINPDIESILFYHIDEAKQLTEIFENGKNISS